MTKIICFLWLVAVSLAGLGGCKKMPKDPENTLQKVTGGTLHVGYSENPPWVMLGTQEPTGLEPELVKGFAKTLQADIKWHRDTEQHLLEALEKKELHLVITGMTDDTPWKKKISFTRPYAKQGKKNHVLAVIMGENAFVTKLEKFLHQQEDMLKAKVSHETYQ